MESNKSDDPVVVKLMLDITISCLLLDVRGRYPPHVGVGVVQGNCPTVRLEVKLSVCLSLISRLASPVSPDY